MKVFRNKLHLYFTAIPEFRHALSEWLSHVTFLIANFRREEVGPLPRPVNVQAIKNTFGLFACDFNSATNMLSLVGVRDRVHCAKMQHHLLGNGSTGNLLRSYRVSCACMGDDVKLISKQLRLRVDKDMSQVEELVASVNKAKFGGDSTVSACVAGVDCGVCDDAVLVLHGHVSVVNEALTLVVRSMHDLKANIIVQKFPFPNPQLMAWVVHSHILDDLSDSLIVESTVDGAHTTVAHPAPPGMGSPGAHQSHPAQPHHVPAAGAANEPRPLIGKYVVHDRNVYVGCMDFLTAVETYRCDALVNSVNPKLDNTSGGLSKVVANFAGPEFERACRCYVDSMALKSLALGTAHYFPSFNLSRKGLQHILNAVIPRNPNGHGTPAMKVDFFNAIKMALTRASEHRSLGVAIPGIGTGDYGWPANEATMLTIQAVVEWLEECGASTTIQSIVFLDLSPSVAEAYSTSLNSIAANLLTSMSPVSKYQEEDENPGPPVLPEYQWYWYAGEDNIPGKVKLEFGGQVHDFVPYNYDHLLQIEDAYLRQQGYVTLSIPGSGTRYRLNFQSKVQVNESNGGTRSIVRKKMDPAFPPPQYAEKLKAYEQTTGQVASVYSSHHAVGTSDLATLAVQLSTIVDYVFSYNTGLTLVGSSWKVEAAVEDLERAVQTATRPVIKSLRPLSGVRSLTFSECLAALSHLMAPSGYTVSPEDAYNWTVEISAVGEEAIYCAETAFERALVDIFCGRVPPLHQF